jgi:hypothetical protein
VTQTIEMIDPVTGGIIDEQQIAEQLLAQAKDRASASSGRVYVNLNEDRMTVTPRPTGSPSQLAHQSSASSQQKSKRAKPTSPRLHAKRLTRRHASRGRCRLGAGYSDRRACI